MAQPYVGEIRMFAAMFAPLGWLFCDGSLQPISGNEVLFQLIGTTYGGDGESTFGMPDLRGRIPIHQGGNFVLGESAGQEEVTLTVTQMAAHSHTLGGSTANGSDANPANNVLATSTLMQPYAVESVAGTLAPGCVSPVGGNQPHTNLQPYLCVNFIICQLGIFPSQG